MALSDIGLYFSNPNTMGGAVNSRLGKIGDFMKSDSMEKLTPFLPAFQDFGTPRFGKTLAGIAQNMASARANARVQTNAGSQPGVVQPPRVQPQVSSPQPGVSHQKVTTTTETDYNQNGIPDSLETSPQAPQIGGNSPLFYNPDARSVPQQMQLGGRGPRHVVNPNLALSNELSFTNGVGDQMVETPAPIAPVSTSAPVPIPQANNPQTYVQNLNKAPMGDLMTIAGNFGYGAAEKALGDRLTRDIAQGELGAKDLTARANYLKAVTDNALLPYDIRNKEAQALHYGAQVKEIENKIQAALPSAIELAERAKTLGIEGAKLEVAHRIVTSEAGKQLIQPNLGFPKGMTVGGLYVLFGTAAPEVLRTAMSNAATITAANIGAEGRVAAAKVADVNSRIYLDALDKEIKNDQARLKEMNDNLFDPTGMAPNDITVASMKKKPMTPQQINDYRLLNEIIKAKSAAYSEAVRAYGAPSPVTPATPQAYAPGAPAPMQTSITVGGQKITGSMQPDGSFLGDNGKTYRPKK